MLSISARAAQGYSPGEASLPPITFKVFIPKFSPHCSQGLLPLLPLVGEVTVDDILQLEASDVFLSIQSRTAVTLL